jgi:hypothetical protein
MHTAAGAIIIIRQEKSSDRWPYRPNNSQSREKGAGAHETVSSLQIDIELLQTGAAIAVGPVFFSLSFYVRLRYSNHLHSQKHTQNKNNLSNVIIFFLLLFFFFLVKHFCCCWGRKAKSFGKEIDACGSREPAVKCFPI